MQDEQQNVNASYTTTTCNRGKRLTVIVELTQANNRNPGNPYSHLTPAERGERLAKLWAAMLRRV